MRREFVLVLCMERRRRDARPLPEARHPAGLDHPFSTPDQDVPTTTHLIARPPYQAIAGTVREREENLIRSICSETSLSNCSATSGTIVPQSCSTKWRSRTVSALAFRFRFSAFPFYSLYRILRFLRKWLHLELASRKYAHLRYITRIHRAREDVRWPGGGLASSPFPHSTSLEAGVLSTRQTRATLFPTGKSRYIRDISVDVREPRAPTGRRRGTQRQGSSRRQARRDCQR